jgi:hypothetical protein
MPSVAEILKASGLDDAAIAALDAKVLAGFNGVLTTAEAERKAAQESAAKAEQERVAAKAAQDAAEFAYRLNQELYNDQIVPSLTGWDDNKRELEAKIANAEATAAFYQTQNRLAKESGFVPADSPVFTPTVPARDGGGKFVANSGGGTPGSPVFKMEDVDNRLGNGLDNGFWAMQEYQRLSGGGALPDSITTLAQEASANKLPFKDYVARKYDFPSKMAALQAQAKEKERQEWVAQATAPLQEQLKAKDTEWQKKLEEKAKEISERGGNNPDVRRAAISNFPEVKKAVAEGVRKDPTMMTRQERHIQTHKNIQETVMANEEAKQGAAA